MHVTAGRRGAGDAPVPATGTPGATLLRLGLAAALLLGVVRPRVRGWQASQWRAVGLYGISLAGTNGFFYAALARLPLGTAVTIQFLGPLTLAAMLSRRWRDAGWVLLAVAGVLTLGVTGSHDSATGHSLDMAGVALVLVSAAFWALYIVAGSRASAAVPGRGGLAVAMTMGALILLPFGAHGAWQVAGRPHLLLIALGMGMLASVVPYTLELAAMRRAPRRVFGILLSLEPAVATLAGCDPPRAGHRARRDRRDRRGDPRERGRHPHREGPRFRLVLRERFMPFLPRFPGWTWQGAGAVRSYSRSWMPRATPRALSLDSGIQPASSLMS